ncbi:MAG: bL21 family ribosomal protein, partial [Terriglobales bacterium]
VFHYKRKKQYKKLNGHRQQYTAVRITEIAFDGQSFKAPEQPAVAKRPKASEGGAAPDEAPKKKASGRKAASGEAGAHHGGSAKAGSKSKGGAKKK